MSESEGDSTQGYQPLFTPENSVAPDVTPPRTPSPPRRTASFFIRPPRLSAAEKALYKPRALSSLKSPKSERPLDEIIGEYKDGGTLYYYARFKAGIAYKFPARVLERSYSDLVQTYLSKKAEGGLAAFDPTANYVHPKDRTKFTLRISPFHSRQPSAELVDDSEEEDDGEDYDYDAESNAESISHTGRRKTALPFSPRKTRPKVILRVDSDNSSAPSIRITRRSTRQSTQKAVINVDSDSEDDDTDSYEPRKKVQKPKAIKPKASQPLYGHCRDVVELDYETCSDEEVAPLRQHRDFCEKCTKAPAHLELQKVLKKKGKPKRRSSIDEFEEDEEERIRGLGGWVRCMGCPVVCHWQCLAGTQRDEILKAARERDIAEWQTSDHEDSLGSPQKRKTLSLNEMTDFFCGSCTKGGLCMGCMESIAPAAEAIRRSPVADNQEISGLHETKPDAPNNRLKPLNFRCLTCKRLAHYQHLALPDRLPEDSSLTEIAEAYAEDWLCSDCSSYKYSVDKIIAWRPYPANATEAPGVRDNSVLVKTSLPREYLVKWSGRSYRRVQWVPHMWLVSTHYSKLKNFIQQGSKVQLQDSDTKDSDMDVDEPTPLLTVDKPSRAPTPAEARFDAVPDADRKIPSAWTTVDRVLDIHLWRGKKAKGKSKGSKSDGGEASTEVADQERILAFERGEQPADEFMETLAAWEARNDTEFSMDNIDLVVWAFMKWDDLPYDEATWDAPPQPDDGSYSAYKQALARFIEARKVKVMKHNAAYVKKFEDRKKDVFRRKYLLKDPTDLKLGQAPELKLMPFQVDGFNWLCNNWWNSQHCILADEMGLGKTVQVTSFLGNIITRFQAFPALVVVPNSTITNWVREFERWAPELRVVPFYGEAKARDIIRKYELYHEERRAGETGAKFHVLVTTYETITNPKDFTSVFKSQPRWEVLVIDEGQRLKSDSSLLFRRLNELKSFHRIIMTGTPLNNNIRELFNLMNFLDPDEWSDLEALEKEHEELTEDLVKTLHNRLRPYFLRRIKSEVLQLPPKAKNEVIVPVSMAPLQKEIYRSILSHNVDLLNNLTQTSQTKSNAVAKGRLNNMLMHLRKCLQHPYLFDDQIEPKGLSDQEAHEKLIDGSAKFRLLRSLLPKLKQRGHRVLLFSQFVIALDVIEDFLVGEGLKYLRLDGNTKGADRQKGMDEFNKPGSDIFIYLLTTRAGGVGINLFSADTVIIFDPDFNPHQDLQAIARAYRYGQQKTCLVFKLMVKDSAEERIMQIGKKKLVLDHLIVQKMDDEDAAGGDVQSILTYGAQALFDAEKNSKDILYSDHDIDKLIEKTEQEGEQEERTADGLSFSFAKVWAADKDTLEEVNDVEQEQGDSWAQTLQMMNAERDKLQAQEAALSGRGARRKAALLKQPNAYNPDLGFGPDTPKGLKKTKSIASDSSVYHNSDVESISDAGDDGDGSDDFAFELPPAPKPKTKEIKGILTNNSHREKEPTPYDDDYCGLCGSRHEAGPGKCYMTDRSENLVEFRNMLMNHADDEPYEQRAAAIQAIDRTLHRRGHAHLIAGQPLHPLRKQPDGPVIVPVAPPQAPRPNMSRITSGSVNNGGGPKRPRSPSAPQTPSKKVRPLP